MTDSKTGNQGVLNAFSVDLEGFVESNRESFAIPEKYFDPAKENLEIEINTNATLELLSELEIKATFFVLGRIANDLPQVVKTIADAGHEIACHSYEHTRLFGVDRGEFKKNLKAAKEKLENIAGQSVVGFRAPEFSITEKTLWAIDVLKELGFVYDSSIYPIGMHDVYGMAEAEPFICKFENGLIEFPMATVKIWGKRIPFGGGGYFRLYPLWLTKMFLKRVNRQNQPAMLYIHPYEIGSQIPRITELSAYRKFRHYYNCDNTCGKLVKLLKQFDFNTVAKALHHHDNSANKRPMADSD